MRGIFTVAAVAAVALTGGVAHAQAKDGWYFAGAITGSDLNKPHQTIANAPAPGSTLQVTNDVDFGGGGQIELGRRLGAVRVEAEIGRTENKSKSYTATSPISITVPQDGKNNATRYMANAYYDLPQTSLPLRLFVGAGLGVADVHVTTFAAPAKAPAAPPSQLIDVSDQVFAYQLMAGLSLPLNDRLAVTGQYRWFDAGTIKGRDSRGEAITREIAGHNFDIGLRLTF
jgi:opacity protein-like surface antigen